MRSRFLFIVFVWCGVMNFLVGQRVLLSKKKVQLGEEFTLNINLSNSDEEAIIIEFNKIVNLDYIKDTAIYEKYADIETQDTSDKSHPIIIPKEKVTSFKLRIFSLGKFKLISNIDSSIVEVMSPSNLNMKSDIKDIKTIIESDEIDWSKYLVGLIFIPIAILAWLIYRNRNKLFQKKKVSHTTVSEAPYYEKALAQLMKMKNEKTWTVEQAKEFQSELTDVLRKYISQRYEIDGQSMLSHDLVKALRYKKLENSQLHFIEETFSIADMVKFAKANPEVSIFEIMVDKAIVFVNETKPKL